MQYRRATSSQERSRADLSSLSHHALLARARRSQHDAQQVIDEWEHFVLESVRNTRSAA